MAASFAGPYVELGAVAERAGDIAEAARRLVQAQALAPSPQLAGLVPAPDSPARAPRPLPPPVRRRRRQMPTPPTGVIPGYGFPGFARAPAPPTPRHAGG